MRAYLARPLTLEVFRFGLVGGIGFVVDVGLLALLTKSFGYNPFASRVVSFLTAATITWALHRSFTFAPSNPVGANVRARSQWIRFLLINGSVAVAGFGLYSGLILIGPTPVSDPVVAAIISAVVAAVFNFGGAKLIVFAPRLPRR